MVLASMPADSFVLTCELSLCEFETRTKSHEPAQGCRHGDRMQLATVAWPCIDCFLLELVCCTLGVAVVANMSMRVLG